MAHQTHYYSMHDTCPIRGHPVQTRSSDPHSRGHRRNHRARPGKTAVSNDFVNRIPTGKISPASESYIEEVLSKGADGQAIDHPWASKVNTPRATPIDESCKENRRVQCFRSQVNSS